VSPPCEKEVISDEKEVEREMRTLKTAFGVPTVQRRVLRLLYHRQVSFRPNSHLKELTSRASLRRYHRMGQLLRSALLHY
jgi:hypothetical protein